MFSALAAEGSENDDDDSEEEKEEEQSAVAAPLAPPPTKPDLFGGIDVDDLEITIETLKAVAADMTLFRSRPFQRLREAIGPLARELVGDSSKGRDRKSGLCTGVFDALEPTDGHLLPTERASATYIWWGHVASRNHAAQAKLMAALSLGLYDALLLPARQADWAALLAILRFGSHKRGQACGALLERFLAHPCAR